MTHTMASMTASPESTHPVELPATITGYLMADERVLWFARPDRALYLRRFRALSGFGLLFLGIAAFWFAVSLVFVGPSSTLVENLYRWWGLPSVIVAALLVYGPMVVARIQWQRTYYALTDRRLIVQRGLLRTRAHVIPLSPMPRLIVEAEGGWGNLILAGGSATERLDAPGRKAYYSGTITLWCIRDPAAVAERITGVANGSSK